MVSIEARIFGYREVRIDPKDSDDFANILYNGQSLIDCLDIRIDAFPCISNFFIQEHLGNDYIIFTIGNHFLDIGNGINLGFHAFGRDVFSIAENDEIFDSTGYVQRTMFINSS